MSQDTVKGCVPTALDAMRRAEAAETAAFALPRALAEALPTQAASRPPDSGFRWSTRAVF